MAKKNAAISFPLFLHQSGQWAKKIRYKMHYFGTDKEQALIAYREQASDLHAGRRPSSTQDREMTVALMANLFLDAKRAALASRDIAQVTYSDYKRAMEWLVKLIDRNRVVDSLAPEDFTRARAKMAKTLSPTSVADLIQRWKTCFKHAHEAEWIENPIRFGPDFKRPSKRTLRVYRASKPKRDFTADECRWLIVSASPVLRAMILLGLNGGFNNMDCSSLPKDAVDLDSGWIDFPRTKTAVPRRVPLWNQTKEALQAASDSRPKPSSPEWGEHFFLTEKGNPWVRITAECRWNSLSQQMRKLTRSLGIHREGVGFGALRHMFQTVGEESGDLVAVRSIMGHADQTMSGVYRERVSEQRLRRVAEVIYWWLWTSSV